MAAGQGVLRAPGQQAQQQGQQHQQAQQQAQPPLNPQAVMGYPPAVPQMQGVPGHVQGPPQAPGTQQQAPQQVGPGDLPASRSKRLAGVTADSLCLVLQCAAAPLTVTKHPLLASLCYLPGRPAVPGAIH